MMLLPVGNTRRVCTVTVAAPASLRCFLRDGLRMDLVMAKMAVRAMAPTRGRDGRTGRRGDGGPAPVRNVIAVGDPRTIVCAEDPAPRTPQVACAVAHPAPRGRGGEGPAETLELVVTGQGVEGTVVEEQVGRAELTKRLSAATDGVPALCGERQSHSTPDGAALGRAVEHTKQADDLVSSQRDHRPGVGVEGLLARPTARRQRFEPQIRGLCGARAGNATPHPDGDGSHEHRPATSDEAGQDGQRRKGGKQPRGWNHLLAGVVVDAEAHSELGGYDRIHRTSSATAPEVWALDHTGADTYVPGQQAVGARWHGRLEARRPDPPMLRPSGQCRRQCQQPEMTGDVLDAGEESFHGGGGLARRTIGPRLADGSAYGRCQTRLRARSRCCPMLVPSTGWPVTRALSALLPTRSCDHSLLVEDGTHPGGDCGAHLACAARESGARRRSEVLGSGLPTPPALDREGLPGGDPWL